MEDFVETHVCKLRGILRSRVLRDTQVEELVFIFFKLYSGSPTGFSSCCDHGLHCCSDELVCENNEQRTGVQTRQKRKKQYEISKQENIYLVPGTSK